MAVDEHYNEHGGFPKFETAKVEPEYGELIEALRRVQDLAVSVDMPADALKAALAQTQQLVATMEPHVVPERKTPAGRVPRLPGRGSLLMLPWTVEKFDADGVRSRGVFRRFHLGGNGAAHGGTLPLLFDDLFGLTQHAYGRPISRTAYLHVNYRKITPLNQPLVVEGHVDKVEGRKTFISATLKNEDGELIADSDALMVQLLPGQQ
ncbi:thioesterase [Rhodococcoides trifolii]|uniref:Acyl-coenzyme A thioesterase THEM4 n=1 Tax=Rhodococcoides trifolii TaxID=908250 RepID=A0A917FQK7_9NOCA|nr:PaaI family thioesterase [Rhodococcus trifolii]GGF96165.1 thioesterase [Rhodococcus trifolii]